jgi:hypothetical protein
MTIAYTGLYQLTGGANLDSTKCQGDLEALGTDAPITTQAIADVASKIFYNGWLYDGASSNAAMTVADFGQPGPSDNPSPNGTVGGFFQANTSLDGLSQITGYAIWVRSSAEAANSQQYAYGLVLHEILHKFTTTKQQADALDNIAVGTLGKDCFR